MALWHLPASRPSRQGQREAAPPPRRLGPPPGKSCGARLFRYKKKNGMKSSLIKCYIERICEDSAGLLASRAALAEAGASGEAGAAGAGGEWHCPECQTTFARNALIHGRPALKLVGGKVRMAKK